jgi:arginyl-tRNA synthetase
MHIFNIVKSRVKSVIKDLVGHNNDIEIAVESPKNPSHGDIAINAAMVLTKLLRQTPMVIAEKLVGDLKQDNNLMEYVESFDIAAPGFINIFLKKSSLFKFLSEVNNKGLQAFDDDIRIGNDRKINIEFVSANPTGPMHIGHARSAIYGDIICRLLRKCGFNVTAEFYINDAGAQIDKLVGSLYIRYRQLLGDDIEIPEGYYPGEYLIDLAKQLKSERGNKVPENDPYIKKFAVYEMMQLIKQDLKLLGVQHDVFTSERSLIGQGLVEEAIDMLQSKGLIYHGVLDKPKGNADEDWEPREQLLFKSTKFGDDSDRAIIKSDGSYSYFASDVALHLDKLRRGYNELFLILGADHAGYISRISAAVNALSNNTVKVNVIVNQLVNIYKDGKPIKMSKRKGNFITVDDLLEELSPDILRFAMLMQKNNTVIDIDCDKMLEKSKENPVFYIQYAHTRISSIIRNASKIFTNDEISIKAVDNDLIYNFSPLASIDYTLLQSELEVALIRCLMEFPRVIELAANHKEPHRIVYYLYEVANQLHSIWHAGVSDSGMRCIIEDNLNLSRARISLLYSVALVIYYGLDIIGVKPLLEM